MPNDYFQFQQFRIAQGNCGMKVCTDSCALGAYAQHSDPEYVLDIGTGTGLLALMLAQRYNARIDAVEVDQKAFSQAETNFKQSPWPDRLTVYNARIQDFSSPRQYDLIISNPPFFQDHVPPREEAKRRATNQEELSFEDLVKMVNYYLSPDGSFWCMLPPAQFKQFKAFAETNQLYCSQKLSISDRKNSLVIRIISSFEKIKRGITETNEVLKNSQGGYSDWYQDLIKDFYLTASNPLTDNHHSVEL